jgi:pimeloyl-ACP methyl ester carboxylesterase
MADHSRQGPWQRRFDVRARRRGWVRAHGAIFEPWEASFTLVQWDQPRAGVTHASNDPVTVEPYSLRRIARDGIALAEFVARRFGGRKIVLLGISGGTMMGLMMIKERPDLFAAYVGCGQIVDWALQDALSYAMLLEDARATGNVVMLEELERIGAPPYFDTATDAIKSKYAGALTSLERESMGAVEPAVLAAMLKPPVGVRYIPAGLELPGTLETAMAAYDLLRSEIVTFDVWKLGLAFEVPMIFLQGELDALAVTLAVEAYAADLRAPSVAFVPLPGCGHMAYLARAEFLRVLREQLSAANGRVKA